ncbi:MAG: hypothetical protein ACHREM_25355, partial [Polyangiales bacterium]
MREADAWECCGVGGDVVESDGGLVREESEGCVGGGKRRLRGCIGGDSGERRRSGELSFALSFALS